MTTPALADTAAIALILGVTPATVRWHAHRGHLTPRGTQRRRTLYAIQDAERLAERLRLTSRPTITNTS